VCFLSVCLGELVSRDKQTENTLNTTEMKEELLILLEEKLAGDDVRCPTAADLQAPLSNYVSSTT